MVTRRLRGTPERIVCLTEETTETLYLLGESDRIVGISAYTVRPPEARRDKPVVSAFVNGSVEKIRALAPDLVVGFSDVQADLARALVSANVPVLITNQRSLEEILETILLIGRIVGREERAHELVRGHLDRLAAAEARSKARTKTLGRRPRVYFEEWPDPMISAIQWVSELIAVAGGDDLFAERSRGRRASERVVTAAEVVARAPDVYLASWCGKPFDRALALSRPGFSELPAARAGRIHEIDPAIILQPGPACLTDGLAALEAILSE